MGKIDAINVAIKEYFDLHKSENEIAAKDLMSWFVKKGVFTKDVKNGLPIRRILRDLDKKGELSKIPSVSPDRKATNTNWFWYEL